MQTTKTVGIAMPPELMDFAEGVARREQRTIGEVVLDALRHYERAQWWEAMNAFGQEEAEKAHLTEADVVPAVRSVRERRALVRRIKA